MPKARSIKAFILIELVVGILIVGMISIATSQLLLYLKKQEIVAYNLSQITLKLENTLLQIEHYIQDAQEITFTHSKLSWKNGNQNVSFFELIDHQLFLNDKPFIQQINFFDAQKFGSHWLIKICSHTICLQRGVLIYGN